MRRHGLEQSSGSRRDILKASGAAEPGEGKCLFFTSVFDYLDDLLQLKHVFKRPDGPNDRASYREAIATRSHPLSESLRTLEDLDRAGRRDQADQSRTWRPGTRANSPVLAVTSTVPARRAWAAISTS